MPTHNEVARNWICGRTKGTHGHHMFYDGDAIFSYGRHFTIARLVYVNGERVALVTTQGYSKSTARHVSIVRRALANSHTIRHVFLVHGVYGSVEHNLVRMMDAAAGLRERATRARTYREMYLNDAAEIEARAHNYRSLFA